MLKKKMYVCEMCGKKFSKIDDHHVIPYWFLQDDSESNIMRVCSFCHRKADSSFNNLILRGRIAGVHAEVNKRVTARYEKKYQRAKQLFRLKLLKRTFYRDLMQYNIKTGEISVYSSWRYRSYKYIDRRNGVTAKARIRLNKAASNKGQVTLATSLFFLLISESGNYD